MASKKSTAASHSLSTMKLTNFDKLALLTELMGDDGSEPERQICDYAADLRSSPFMLRFLRDAVKEIVRQYSPHDAEDSETVLALRIAELHFASRASLAC